MSDDTPSPSPPPSRESSRASSAASSAAPGAAQGAEPASVDLRKELTQEAASSAGSSRRRSRVSDRARAITSGDFLTVELPEPLRLGKGQDYARELRRTRSLIDTTAGEGRTGDTENLEQDASLLMLVTDELSSDDHDRVLALIDKDPEASRAFKQITAHLEQHHKVRPVAPPVGSFLRMTERMRERGYLAYAYPGSYCLWRRSFLMAMLALAVLLVMGFIARTEGMSRLESGVNLLPMATLTTFDRDGNPTSAPQAVALGARTRVSSDSAAIWLATGIRGVASSLRMRRDSEFVLQDLGRLTLERGFANRVEIHPLSTGTQHFLLLTPHIQVKTRGATFSVSVSAAGRSVVNVLDGAVDVNIAGNERVTTLVAGFGISVLNGVASTPFPLLQANVAQIGLSQQVRVRLQNQSLHRVRITKAGDPRAFHYWMTVNADAVARAEVPLLTRFPLLPLIRSGASSDQALIDRHFGDLWLEPQGADRLASNAYDFTADLALRLAGVDSSTYSMELVYEGPITFEDHETLNFRRPSSAARLDFRPTD